MISVLLFALTISASAVVSIFYKKYTLAGPRGRDIFTLLFCCSAPLAAAYAVICSVGGMQWEPILILCAVFSAALSMITIVTLITSMRKGLFSVSVIIINLNFCIPILLSRIFLKENVSLFQLVGILILVVIVVVTNLSGKKKDQSNQSDSSRAGGKKYLIFALAACVANGLVNFLIKLQQYYMPGYGQTTFYFVMYSAEVLFCLIGFAVFSLLKRRKQSLSVETEEKPNRIKIAGIGLGIGLCIALSLFPQSILPQYVSAPVQFTVTAAGAVALSLAIGFFQFREKLDRKIIISTVCCILAISLQLITS